MKSRRDGKSYFDKGPLGCHKITENEKTAYNYGIMQAQWYVTKAMLALGHDLPIETKRLLKFIYDEIGKELK